VAFVSFVVFVSFVHAQDAPTEADLDAASGGRTVRIRVGNNGSRRVMDMPIEVYVARVLAGEGEPRARDAAQEALAIAIRTFAAANSARHRRDGFDLCDTTHCQVLRASTAASRRAAQATAGQLLVFDGRPAEVFYSASCGGRSEAASQVWPGAIDHPYLTSIADDVHGGEVPWVVDLPAAQIEQALHRAGFDGKRLKDLDVEQRSASGRVTRLRLSGLRPDTIAGDDFRLAIGARELRSTSFTVKKVGRAFRFTGRGYGHGVGLCVVGAGLRAARGETARQILARYFPGLAIESGAAPAPTVADPRTDIDRMASRARDEIAAALHVTAPPPLKVDVHESLDAYRQATGRPWWVSASVTGTTIDLAPVPVLMQGDGVEPAIRRGVAEALVSEALADRPAWVKVGAARYFAAPLQPETRNLQPETRNLQPGTGNLRCPSDAELTLALSAAAHRDAEIRAEACFAEALARAGDWRLVRRHK